MALEGTVKTPFGAMKKKTAVIVGGGGAVVVGIAYYRSKQAAAANAAATASAATSAANGTGDPSAGIDPATGYPYGSAEDAAAIAGQQGISYNPYSPLGGGGGGNPFPPGANGPPFTANYQWAQYCETAMGSTGSDAIASAIGHYLAGAQLQDSEVTIVQEAIAIGGQVPVPASDGYPPSYRTGGGTPPPGGVKVPNVVGMETGAGDREIVAAGLKFSHKTLGPQGSTITSTSPTAGTLVASGSTVNVTFKEKSR